MLDSLPKAKDRWQPPEQHTYRFNFYSASLGNPGISGLTDIIQDSHSNLILIYTANIGVDTNNSVETWPVAIGMRLEENNVLRQLVVEGDLQLMINLIKKLMTKFHTQNLQIQ